MNQIMTWGSPICHNSTTSMHPSSSTYLGLAGGGSRLGGVILTNNTFHFLPRGSHGIPIPDEIKKIRHPFRKFWVCPGVFSQVAVLKKKPQREEPRRHPNQIPKPPQLTPSMQRSSGSTLSSLRMSELLTLSKAEPSEPTKEAHLSTCVLSLILLVTTHNGPVQPLQNC